MRINKYLSQIGFCSRREADKLIEAKRVKLNGELAEHGDKVWGEDVVLVDDKLVQEQNEKIYLAFNKPIGVITTTDSKRNKNIMEYIKIPKRVYPIGRLDVASCGLILLTNDGNLANKLTKTENKIEKEYLVTVDQPISNNVMKFFEKGVELDGVKTLPAVVERKDEYHFRIVIVQGLNRQIRRMCEKFGLKVTFLKRVRVANIKLEKLEPGRWRQISGKELKELQKS